MSGHYDVRSCITNYELLNLRICHLLDTLLLDLSLWSASRQQIHLSLLGRADDQLEEFVMIVNRIVDQRKICRTRLLRGVEDAAVWIDLEHIDRSIRSHAIIAARISIAIHSLEEVCCLFAQNLLDLGIIDGCNGHLLVFNPFHVVMLERFSFRENEFYGLECNGTVGIIGIFRDETGELASFDEFFEEGASELFNFLFGLDLELLQILTT